jgi:mRNA interferase MazF
VKGDVVVVPFPFSDLTQSKRRPALIVASPQGDDLILCQITSQSVRDRYAVRLETAHFHDGSLKQSSQVRPNRLFTADRSLILYRVAGLAPQKLQEVIEAIVLVLRE